MGPHAKRSAISNTRDAASVAHLTITRQDVARAPTTPLTSPPPTEWSALAEHYRRVAGLHLRELFADDPGRAEALTATGADLVLDYSKHRITRDTLPLLTALARRAGLPERTEAMFAGRAHQHQRGPRGAAHRAARPARASRSPSTARTCATDVHAVLDRMGEFTDAVRSGAWTGHTGERIRAVVNIGIGGSDLGPGDGLRGAAGLRRPRPRRCGSSPTSTRPTSSEALRDLDPATTLFIVSSKTFTTLETLTNARAARQWLVDGLGDE